LDNAIRYGNGLPVELSLSCEPHGITVRVADRGVGIPQTELERVFRPFQRLESARGRDTGGSGLGLAIARQLADRHGWKLALSARDGGGTIAELCIVGSCRN
jgi:two-component system osmolarity sensor histidine kinase EnvZ